MEEKEKRILKRKMDFIPSVFLQNERVSKFIGEMNQFNAKHIKKLETLISDFEGDLKYHIRKKLIEDKKKDESSKLTYLKNLNEQIEKLDVFKNPEEYMKLLIKKKGEIINLSGIIGLIPDYVSGMPKHEV